MHVQAAAGVAVLQTKAQVQQAAQMQGLLLQQQHIAQQQQQQQLRDGGGPALLPPAGGASLATSDLRRLAQALANAPPLGLAQMQAVLDRPALAQPSAAVNLQAFLQLSSLIGTTGQAGCSASLSASLQQQLAWLAGGGRDALLLPQGSDRGLLQHLLDAAPELALPPLPAAATQQQQQQPSGGAASLPGQRGDSGSVPASLEFLPDTVETLLLQFIQAAVPDPGHQARGTELTSMIKLALQQ